MEDKSSSALAMDVPDFVHPSDSDRNLQSAAFSGDGDGESGDNGGHSVVETASSNAVIAYPAASWLEFTEWLERSLDDCGLEPTLYARCVLSILKQPPELATDTSMDHDEEWVPTAAATSFLSVVSHRLAKNNSAPSSRKNSFSQLACAATATSASTMAKTDPDTRKQALLDCLKSINSDGADLEKFVDDIVQRYSLVCKPGVLGEKQNESVDSGVCPSPEESFQNYDEAFPPLGNDCSLDGSVMDVFVNDNIVGIRPRVASSSWLSGKRPAETRAKPAVTTEGGHQRPVVVGDVKGDGEQGDASGQSDGSPVKRPKLVTDFLDRDNGGRTLHSCPDFVHSSGVTASVSIYTSKRATFCCPVVKKQASSYLPSAGLKIPPQFVIPKFWKVGSWPSRYDRTTKPAGDVPFWPCSEWFCTVHKRLEFGLLNAKISGDTKVLAAPPASASVTMVASYGGNEQTVSAAPAEFADNVMDVDIFEIDPPLPPPQQQQYQPTWNHGRDVGHQLMDRDEQQQAQVVPEMFDAPRFILHIINEDEGAIKEKFTPMPEMQNAECTSANRMEKTQLPSSDWTSFFDLGTADTMFAASQNMADPKYGNDNDFAWAAMASKPDFSFGDPPQCNVAVGSSNNIILPVDVSHTTSGDLGFCLPKCGRFPVIGQLQQMAPAAGVYKKLENQAIGSGSLNENFSARRQPQSVAVPIRENTHFRPIRSESMEDAYYLKPGFDEFSVIDNIDEYHIYQQDDSFSSSDGAPSLIAQAALVVGKEKSGEKRRRSLPLKFRAIKPNKMCQTDVSQEANPDLAENEESMGDVTTLLERYHHGFEIWAFQPSEIKNRLNVNIPKWSLNESMDSNDGMVVGPLSPHIDDGWLNDLVGGDSPPPPLKSKEAAQENLFNANVQDGGLVDTIQQQAAEAVVDDQQRMEIWQQEDERYEDSLLRYVSNISLISPLDIQTTTV